MQRLSVKSRYEATFRETIQERHQTAPRLANRHRFYSIVRLKLGIPVAPTAGRPVNPTEQGRDAPRRFEKNLPTSGVAPGGVRWLTLQRRVWATAEQGHSSVFLSCCEDESR